MPTGHSQDPTHTSAAPTVAGGSHAMGAAPLPSVVTTYASSMSSLWTPEGEHRVPRPGEAGSGTGGSFGPGTPERPVRREAREVREVRKSGSPGSPEAPGTPGGSQRKPAVAVRRGPNRHHERGRAGNRGGNARGRQAPCRRPAEDVSRTTATGSSSLQPCTSPSSRPSSTRRDCR